MVGLVVSSIVPAAVDDDGNGVVAGIVDGAEVGVVVDGAVEGEVA